MAKVLSIVGNA
jgi:hypothetical protein